MLFDDKYINKVDKRVLKTAEIEASIEFGKNVGIWCFR